MKQRLISCVFLWILSVGYYFLILSYSAAPAGESSAKSAAVTRKIVDIYDNVMRKKSTEKSKNIRVINLHKFIRKCAHVYNFMVLTISLCLLFYVAIDGDVKKVVWLSLVMGLCGAAYDEFSQLFVAGRAGQIKDIFIDMIGSCQGGLAFLVFNKLFVKEVNPQ